MKKALPSFMLFITLLFFTNVLYAQRKVILCADYTADGEPISPSNVWDVKPPASSVYVIYKNNSERISYPKLYFYVDKLDGAAYKPFDSLPIVPDKYKNWALYDYTFTQPGTYRFTFVDNKGNELANEVCNVNFKTESISSNTINPNANETVVPTEYYEGSKVALCEDVDATGNAVHPSAVFNIGQNGGFIMALVTNRGQLKTKQLIIDVYKGADSKEFVETLTINVDPAQSWAKFKYIFYKAGNYRFNVYNSDESFVNAAEATVNVR